MRDRTCWLCHKTFSGPAAAWLSMLRYGVPAWRPVCRDCEDAMGRQVDAIEREAKP